MDAKPMKRWMLSSAVQWVAQPRCLAPQYPTADAHRCAGRPA